MRKVSIVLALLFPVLSLLAREHPYLLYNPDATEKLKNELRTDMAKQAAWKTFLADADRSLDRLALVYRVTGHSKYAEKVKQRLLDMADAPSDQVYQNETSRKDPPWISSLPTAGQNYQMAVAYDAIYDALSAEERKEIAQIIRRVGIEPTLHDWLDEKTRFHTINSMGHNYWIACSGMMGIAAMAVSSEIPEAEQWVSMAEQAADEWINFQGDRFQNKMPNFEHGLYYESVNYANFGLQEFLLFRLAQMQYRGERSSTDPDLSLIGDYFVNVCYPSATPGLRSLWFGDSGTYTNGEAPCKLVWALGYHNPNILWYLSRIEDGQAKESMPASSPLGLLYSPSLDEAPSSPNLPESTLYERAGWGMMRSSWEDDATFLAVKCGHTWNHSHADASSFILYHNGEILLKDAGNCWYPNPEYRDYFFQSEAHNVVLFDGKAQPREQQYMGTMQDGTLSNLVSDGSFKYILADATGPTSRYFFKNFRNYLWMDDVILIMDDVRSWDYGTFSYLLHPEGVVRKRGVDIEITHGNAAVTVRPLWPEYLTESDFEHDYPDNLKLRRVQAPLASDLKQTEEYLSVTSPSRSNQMKFITAIILKDGPEDGHAPVVMQIGGDEALGVRIRQEDKTTDVWLNTRADGHIMHRNSCNTLGPWDTDAYILAYSYAGKVSPVKASDVSEWFIAYGSYIRSADEVVFSSFEKQTRVVKR